MLYCRDIRADGSKAIEEIQVGDRVYAKDVQTGEQAVKEVKTIYRYEVDTLVHLTIDGEEIVTTEIHPFYVDGKGWVEAADLEERDKVLDSENRTIQVEKIEIERLDKQVTVYNFEVEDYHTYYVGEAGILVHNSCAPKQTGDQKALLDLAKESAKQAKQGNPISYDEAKIIDEWAVEYNVPQHHQAYYGSGEHFKGGNYADHTHIYNVHVPYTY